MTTGNPALLDPFVPTADVRGRHQVLIHAPAALVMDVAQKFPMESIWLVRTLFRVRARLLEGPAARGANPAGLVDQLIGGGWQKLDEMPGRYLIAGASCQPWEADPGFSPVGAQPFAEFAEPGRVKIAWTLETNELSPELTCFATETRAVATDRESRLKFKRYWRKFGAGIILIRLVLLPAVRRRAERLWKAQKSAASSVSK